MKKFNWIDISRQVEGRTDWIGIYNPVIIDNEKYLGYYTLLGENMGKDYFKSVLTILFSEKELYSLISREHTGGKIVFVCSDTGTIITSTERVLLGRNVSDVLVGDTFPGSGENGNTIIDYAGSQYIAVSKKMLTERLGINGWEIVYLIPTANIFSGIKAIWITSIIICIFAISFSLLFILMLSQNITGRISNLIMKMKEVNRENLKIAIKITGFDEIGTLEMDFNRMLLEIDKLIKEVYEAEIKNQIIQVEKKEALICALQGQINPHYLFNTLESIRMKLLLKGDIETSNVIDMFGQSFKVCFENKGDVHTIYDEMRFVESYFSVQKYRYGDKLRYIKNIPEEVLGFYVPKLILQPLVENSIYHGIEIKKGTGTVIINAGISDEVLILEVVDDGVGMCKDALDKLTGNIYGNEQKVDSMGQSRIALRNIHKRISLMYGEKYGMQISSHENIGTTILIKLPLISLQ